MPAKNSVKQYDTNAYYHVYNRGTGKQPIFLDAQDKRKFLSLLARHLDADSELVRGDGRTYETYELELVAFCLMKNHFHLLLYQLDDIEAVTKLLRSVSTAYTMYFNFRYKRQGGLFQGIFKASKIQNESYLEHISRYIHLNPRTYKTYAWSSLAEFVGRRSTSWVHPERILDMTPEQYLFFLEDYEERRELIDTIKHELAI